MNNFQLYVLAIIFGLILTADAASWSYVDDENNEGPSNWATNYPTCGGNSQSPINIVTVDTETSSDTADFQFHRYSEDENLVLKLKNNGHTAQVDLVSGLQMILSGGGLPEDYRFAQFHLHWGSTNKVGSEHTINGEAYPLEMHLVHYASIYATLLDGAVQPKGLAVLGFFFELSQTDNEALTGLLNAMVNITEADTFQEIPPFAIESLFTQAVGDYFRYSGSLTTPGCYESVIWTVFETPLPISSSQLDVLRSLKDDNGTAIVDNYRPVQDRNSRDVYHHKHGETSAAPKSATHYFISITVTAVMMLK